MRLSLRDLGRFVFLGKAFRSAFQRRHLQVEKGLTSVGLAASGKPLLQGMGEALQQYFTHVESGCRPTREFGNMSFERLGPVMLGTDSYYSGGVPCAAVEVRPSAPWSTTQGSVRTQDLCLSLRGFDGAVSGARLVLRGPTGRTSARHRIESAMLSLPDPLFGVHGVHRSEHLGAFFLACQSGGEGPMCLNSPDATHMAGEGRMCLQSQNPPHYSHGAPAVTPSCPLGGGPVRGPQGNLGNPASVREADSGTVVSQPIPRWPLRKSQRAVRRVV
jgi:hypothetical protein